MKVRIGFVSNSSSSSYIIKINESESCSTCGRKTPNIVDYINSKTIYDDTCVKRESKQSILDSINEDICSEQKSIKRFSYLNPDEVPPEFRHFGSKTTAREYIEQCSKNIEKLKCKYEYFSSIDGEICEISISYHDDYTNQIFQEGVSDGSIEVIEDNK